MISVTVPGDREYALEHLVLDCNGTLAFDGSLSASTRDLLVELSKRIRVHVITADTFGTVRSEMSGVNCVVTIVPSSDQIAEKHRYVQALGSGAVVAIGNGCNDRLMVEEAAIGIAVIQGEGAFSETVSAADIVCLSIDDALALLKHPKRLVATLRR
jgi:soluble P-type ATPase